MTDYRPDPKILELGDAFYDVVGPARFPQAIPRFLNQRAAASVGLELDADAWERHFHRFEPLPGNLPAPLALKY
ncbi:MAG TPA: selenoprotein O, partial [Sphingomicrobium sp.]|nr:selenoprotein O [Sphingomicrobium sp.]